MSNLPRAITEDDTEDMQAMVCDLLFENGQDRNTDEDNDETYTNFSSDDSCRLKKWLVYTPPTLALPADDDSYYSDSEN